MTLFSLTAFFFLLVSCCWAIFRFLGLLSIHLWPLCIVVSPFRISIGSSRHLAVGETQISFHIPRRKRRIWASISIKKINYRSDASQHFTIAEVLLTFLFPFSVHEDTIPRPAPISLSLHDFCLRIPSSKNTPSWIVALRRNILYTILNEETQRLDEFRMKTIFSTLKLRQRNADGGDSLEDIKDESRITHHSSQWHIYNRATYRLYQFGRLAAQLRRIWEDDTGTFSLVAEDSHWVRQSHFQENDLQPGRLNRLLVNMCSTIFFILRIPTTLYTLYKCPSSIYTLSYLVDIHISRTDITFDSFHISDAEPLRHGAELLRRNFEDGTAIWSALLSNHWVLNLISAAIIS
ncbi:hypothetical protein GG344DRAFT_38972 [Lentinula edodes]|nr:hypothetical protein GG344DRAFT_38972 [Lentinula edodes]